MRTLIIPALIVLAGRAAALDVTACGQVVSSGDVGVLQADLACTAPVPGIRLETGATLDLNGHALTTVGAAAVACEGRRCVVTSTPSSGALSGSPAAACLTTVARTRLSIANVAVHDCGTCIDGNVANLADQGANVRATNVTVERCSGSGIVARRLRATGIAVTDAGDSGIAVEGRVQGIGLVASRNGRNGVFARSVVLRDAVVDENAGIGIASTGGMKVTTAEILNNNRLLDGIDVASTRRPRFVAVICGRSAQFGTAGTPWGICAGD
ncbi:MAG: hypothetical protein ACREQL_00220 [Candidatus Binatia bacterium]